MRYRALIAGVDKWRVRDEFCIYEGGPWEKTTKQMLGYRAGETIGDFWEGNVRRPIKTTVKKRRLSHYANINRSTRLQNTMKILADGQYHTTAEIQKITKSAAVHTDIHELRRNGINISPARYQGRTSKGRKIYDYRIAK